VGLQQDAYVALVQRGLRGQVNKDLEKALRDALAAHMPVFLKGGPQA
jgi:hypothetical protein